MNFQKDFCGELLLRRFRLKVLEVREPVVNPYGIDIVVRQVI